VTETSSVNQVTTSVSTARIDQDRVVYWDYNDGAVVTLEEAKEEIVIIGRLVTPKGGRLLIDIRSIRSITREARALFASDETSGMGVIGLALVIKSSVSRMIGNVYFYWNKTAHPTRLFTDPEKARAWLVQLPERF
jgi:hypothetical protein